MGNISVSILFHRPGLKHMFNGYSVTQSYRFFYPKQRLSSSVFVIQYTPYYKLLKHLRPERFSS